LLALGCEGIYEYMYIVTEVVVEKEGYRTLDMARMERQERGKGIMLEG